MLFNHYTIEASYKKGQIFHVESNNVLLFCEVKIEMHVTYNEWILPVSFCGIDCQKSHFSLISDTLSVGGC